MADFMPPRQTGQADQGYGTGVWYGDTARPPAMPGAAPQPGITTTVSSRQDKLAAVGKGGQQGQLSMAGEAPAPPPGATPGAPAASPQYNVTNWGQVLGMNSQATRSAQQELARQQYPGLFGQPYQSSGASGGFNPAMPSPYMQRPAAPAQQPFAPRPVTQESWQDGTRTTAAGVTRPGAGGGSRPVIRF